MSAPKFGDTHKHVRVIKVSLVTWAPMVVAQNLLDGCDCGGQPQLHDVIHL